MAQRIITNGTGVVSYLKEDRAFGFLIFTTSLGRQLRIYFHFADAGSTVLRLGDSVIFDIGADGQGRPRAFNVKFLEAAPAPAVVERQIDSAQTERRAPGEPWSSDDPAVRR